MNDRSIPLSKSLSLSLSKHLSFQQRIHEKINLHAAVYSNVSRYENSPSKTDKIVNISHIWPHLTRCADVSVGPYRLMPYIYWRIYCHSMRLNKIGKPKLFSIFQKAIKLQFMVYFESEEIE